MRMKKEIADLRLAFEPLTFYQKFEHFCVLILTAIIAAVIVFALLYLALNVLQSILSSTFDPTDSGVFHSVFGMIFTVIIALEFNRSLVALAERSNSIVQVRSVLLIGLLAVVRKLIILDVSQADAMQLFGLAAAIFALGGAYWLVRDRRRRDTAIVP